MTGFVRNDRNLKLNIHENKERNFYQNDRKRKVWHVFYGFTFTT